MNCSCFSIQRGWKSMGQVVLRGEATNTNYIVFGLTQPGLEPTTYSTRGEHANHYTTNAVKLNNINLVKEYILYTVLSTLSLLFF
jgi:hypothetical protein